MKVCPSSRRLITSLSFGPWEMQVPFHVSWDGW